MRGLLSLAVVSPWMSLSILGELLILRPAIGWLTMAAIAALGYTGWRLWNDPHISVPMRKIALAAAALSAGIFCSGLVFAVAAADHADWRGWQSSGAGIKPGMTVGEARAAASLRARVGSDGSLELTLRPKGLAALHYVFKDVYGVSLSTGSGGRVEKVQPWSD
jgi:hypothetical protein